MKKLEIGKTEIVIYPEKGNTYLSIKRINSVKNQRFNSSNFPNELRAVYIGEEIIEGKKYEKYTLKTIPNELQKFLLYGRIGLENLSKEIDLISAISQGKTEDGRKILYVRSMNIKDVNNIFGVTIDFDNKRINQKGQKNINCNSDFGDVFDINKADFNERQIKLINEYIKRKVIKSTVYKYYKKDIYAEEYLKELIFLPTPYYLNSIGVNASCNIFGVLKCILLGCGVVSVNSVSNGEKYIFSLLSENADSCNLGVRPVFFLEPRKIKIKDN